MSSEYFHRKNNVFFVAELIEKDVRYKNFFARTEGWEEYTFQIKGKDAKSGEPINQQIRGARRPAQQYHSVFESIKYSPQVGDCVHVSLDLQEIVFREISDTNIIVEVQQDEKTRHLQYSIPVIKEWYLIEGLSKNKYGLW